MKKMIDKKGVVSEYLPWILIAIAILVILVIGIMVLRDRGITAIDRLISLFRGR